ncbi:hypothetical protein DM02DRAFT_619100 [Periconia macrospinosa]|uniref:Uncharacterized protein n=1 Tax=Periconia macrospinosa TaxID=97972 RepID=A0A2V1D6N7_9PLEO|nr:hypothetical protein DM02DRAFT_619100 [Periconia macrospinosa]
MAVWKQELQAIVAREAVLVSKLNKVLNQKKEGKEGDGNDDDHRKVNREPEDSDRDNGKRRTYRTMKTSRQSIRPKQGGRNNGLR